MSGASSDGPSTSCWKRTRVPPVLTMSSTSMRTAEYQSQRFDKVTDADSRISTSVSQQINFKESSTCSATDIMARIIGSERGTWPRPTDAKGKHLSDPISTIARISLTTCSRSTAYLLSRANDLCGANFSHAQTKEIITYFTMYHSNGCSNSLSTESLSKRQCRNKRKAHALDLIDAESESAGATLTRM